MRSGPFNNLMTKILVLLVAGLLLTMIGSQIYRYLHDRHDTQEAVLATINEDIAFDGIIIRDETAVNYNGSGVISYTYADGSKVSKGDCVAKIFTSQEDAAAEKKLEKTEAQIEQLRKAQSPGTTDYVQPESIGRKIDEHYKQMLNYANAGDYEGVESQKQSMSLAMSIYNIISGAAVNYDARIAELEQQASVLSAQADNAKDTVIANQTGYFVSYCDGYEDTLDKSRAYSLTQADIEKLISGAESTRQSVPESEIGKMFLDYSCLIVGVIENDARVAEDATLRLTLDSSDIVYNVNVVSVKAADEQGKSVVIMSCDSLDEYIVRERIQSMQLIFDEYSGLKVPRSAIRFRGEDKGVYVILGEDITFKKIDVIYEGDDFVISKNTAEEDHLLLYDQILLEVVTEQDVGQSDSGGDSSVVSGSG